MKNRSTTSAIVILLLSIAGSIFAADTASVTSFISADDPLFHYTGRIDFATPSQPTLFWSGSSITARFQGTSVSAILWDEKGENRYHIEIDGTVYPTLDCKKGKRTYQIASGLEDGDHEILIYRRNEFGMGWTKFLGLLLDNDKELTWPVYVPSRRIEFYGDSITCGMGNEDETLKNNFDMTLENNYMTYAAMTARNLKAQMHAISKSGIGFMVSWAPIIMNDYYDLLNPNDPQSKWDFSLWTPDVVVINLGTNDYWLLKRFKPEYEPTEISKIYADFVRKIRAKYPKAYIFCTLGNMNSTVPESPMPGYIKAAVEMIRTEDNDTRIDSLIFKYKETDGHPIISEHQAMADELTKKIKDTMGW